MAETEELPPREAMDYDVVIVGAGPAGLSAAIRLKQISPDLSVVVIEKGSEPGAHILSGAVIDPIGLDRLLPDWRDDPDQPLKTQVHDDQFYLLTQTSGFRMPNALMPKLMNNHGNFVGSLAMWCAGWRRRRKASASRSIRASPAPNCFLATRAKSLGVATGDMGVGRDGQPKDSFTRGMELRGKYTLFAEGARGSLAKQIIAKFGLAQGREPQKFGIGFKELWRIDKEKHKAGLVQHSFGWPLASDTGGGSFLYHFDEDLLSIGFVVHLNYSNPTLSPFDEFQRFKTHPLIAPTLEGGKRISYGARALTEGGWQSVPKLVFPGGALLGCAAGFMNVPRIKGSHNAMLSGILAADHVAKALEEGRAHDEVAAMTPHGARRISAAI